MTASVALVCGSGLAKIWRVNGMMVMTAVASGDATAGTAATPTTTRMNAHATAIAAARSAIMILMTLFHFLYYNS